MTARELHAASDRLRVIAEAVTPGPWKAVPNPHIGGWAVTPATAEPELAYLYVADFTSEPNADYIAAMHPAVALVLADWLEATPFQVHPDPCPCTPGRCTTKAALAVARLINPKEA